VPQDLPRAFRRMDVRKIARIILELVVHLSQVLIMARKKTQNLWLNSQRKQSINWMSFAFNVLLIARSVEVITQMIHASKHVIKMKRYASLMHAESMVLSKKTMIAVVLLEKLGVLQDLPKAFRRMDVRNTARIILELAVVQSQDMIRRNLMNSV
jgi:hypothetical protein